MSAALITLLVLLASYLMLSAGASKRRLVSRDPRCAVCGYTRSHCTCRWL